MAAAEVFPRAALRGWDINPEYVQQAMTAVRAAGAFQRVVVECRDFFRLDWEAEIEKYSGNLLVLGNPPWVTNSAIGALDGANVPSKENFLGLRGLAARTGKSNFDISEWMLVRLVRALRGRFASLAVLCKSATARRVLRYAWQNDGRVAEALIYQVDASAHFGVSVDACLLLARLGSAGPAEADVYASLSAPAPAHRIGLAGQDLVSDLQTYRQLQHLEGLCPFQWRSGVKHDCAAVMEFRRAPDGMLENKLGERVELEPERLYPLIKCTDLANGRAVPQRLILVTQHRMDDDTGSIARSAPKTWQYLQSHRPKFEARKSSIYRGRAPFALFGIGDYTFALWKVAVSGLHSTCRFQVVGPCRGRPVILDDTCYYLSFEDEAQARLVAAVLNSGCCQRFLRSLMFTDAKRPITVELLQRLNMSGAADEAGFGPAWRSLNRVNYASFASTPQLELVMETA